MSEATAVVLAAIITGGFGVIIAYVGRVEKHAKAAVDQVKNSHTTNLRDDMDAMHADIRGVLDRQTRVMTLQLEHSSQIAGLRADLLAEQRDRQKADEAISAVVHEIIDT